MVTLFVFAHPERERVFQKLIHHSVFKNMLRDSLMGGSKGKGLKPARGMGARMGKESEWGLLCVIRREGRLRPPHSSQEQSLGLRSLGSRVLLAEVWSDLHPPWGRAPGGRPPGTPLSFPSSPAPPALPTPHFFPPSAPLSWLPPPASPAFSAAPSHAPRAGPPPTAPARDWRRQPALSFLLTEQVLP